MTAADEVVLEPARLADVDAIVAISQASFPLPWPREAYLDELARAHAHVDVARAAPGGELVGYAVTWQVADEVQLLEIATTPARRRCGIGDALLAAVCDRADAAHRLVSLEVRAGNTAARSLYVRHRFAVVATRRACYDDGEDAIVMVRPHA